MELLPIIMELFLKSRTFVSCFSYFSVSYQNKWKGREESLSGNEVISREEAAVIFGREKYPSLMLFYIWIHQMFIEGHLAGVWKKWYLEKVLQMVQMWIHSWEPEAKPWLLMPSDSTFEWALWGNLTIQNNTFLLFFFWLLISLFIWQIIIKCRSHTRRCMRE